MVPNYRPTHKRRDPQLAALTLCVLALLCPAFALGQETQDYNADRQRALQVYERE